MSSSMPSSRREWVLGACMALVLLVVWSLRIGPEEVTKDAGQTLQLAINLHDHGILAEEREAPFTPSMVREPLPAVVGAAFVAIGNAFYGPAERIEDYFSGERAAVLKYQNVIWMLLLCAGLFALVRTLTASSLAGAVTVLVVNVLVLMSPVDSRYMIDSLYTEAPAAALLVWISWCLLQALRQERWWPWLTAGILLGLLILTKASFLYISVGFVAVAVGFVLLGWSRDPVARGLGKVLALTVCTALVVVPWMVRNLKGLGTFAVSERGGEVLYTRAVKDRMTALEIRGAIFYWAPYPLDGALRRVLGFSRSDLERGGKLQRLNRGARSSFAEDDLAAEAAGRPQDAISYYRAARAERVRLMKLYEAAGDPKAELHAQDALQERALEMILEKPGRHLAMTPLFIWRGSPFSFALLVLTLIVALRSRNHGLALALMPMIGMLSFYALFSHFIPRYALPAMPLAVAMTVVLVAQGWNARRALRTGRIDPQATKAREQLGELT